jgi:hypothetical protein
MESAEGRKRPSLLSQFFAPAENWWKIFWTGWTHGPYEMEMEMGDASSSHHNHHRK